MRALDAGLSLDAARLDGVRQSAVVALVLVRVDLREIGERVVEALARSEVGGDRHAVARAGVSARERGAAELAVELQPLRLHRLDVERQLPVPELAYVVVALHPVHIGRPG